MLLILKVPVVTDYLKIGCLVVIVYHGGMKHASAMRVLADFIVILVDSRLTPIGL